MSNLFLDLRESAIFQSFGGNEYWDKMEVPARTRVLDEGEKSEDFYFIFSGELAVLLKTDADAEAAVVQLEAGDFFGEASLLTGCARGASVQTLTDAVLLRLSKDKFKALMTEDPAAGSAFLMGVSRVLSERLRTMNDRLRALYELGQASQKGGSDLHTRLMHILKPLTLPGLGFSFVIYDESEQVLVQSPELPEKMQKQFEKKAAQLWTQLFEEGGPVSMKLGAKDLFVRMGDAKEAKGVFYVHADSAIRGSDLHYLVSLAQQIALSL